MGLAFCFWGVSLLGFGSASWRTGTGEFCRGLLSRCGPSILETSSRPDQMEEVTASAASAASASASALAPASQQQQQQQAQTPKQEAAAMPVGHGAQEETAKEPKGRRSRSSSSSNSTLPSRQALSRTVRNLQEEVDTHGDMLGEVKKQLLWTMSQQVRSDRALTSRQLVLQGFATAAEDKRVGIAMDKRNQWIAKMLQESTGLEPSRLTFEASHATTHDALSCLSIITLRDQSIASTVARVMTTRKFNYEGVPITWKRQQTAYDRIVSAPAKCCMDIISRNEPKYQSCLRPNWHEGYVAQVADRAEPDILFRWLVNPERARIRLYITKKLIHIVEGDIDTELRKLQFGPVWPDKGKGGKGGGKSKKGKKGGAPIDPQAFRQEPSMVRDQLGNLTFARYPFNISIRELKEDGEPDTKQEEKQQRPEDSQDMEVGGGSGRPGY